MSKLTIGILAAGLVWVASSAAIVVLLLAEAPQVAPEVRERVTHVPAWLREHTPAPLVPGPTRAEFDAIHDELGRIRELLQDRESRLG